MQWLLLFSCAWTSAGSGFGFPSAHTPNLNLPQGPPRGGILDSVPKNIAKNQKQNLHRQFKVLDQNGDGKISLSEFEEQRKHLHNRRNAVQEGKDPRPMEGFETSLIGKIGGDWHSRQDADKDGYVSEHEFDQRLTINMKDIDIHGKTTTTPPDLEKVNREMRETHENQFNAMDEDKDGRLTKYEMKKFQDKLQKRKEDHGHQALASHEHSLLGKLERHGHEEFHGKRDHDGDGHLTIDEFTHKAHMEADKKAREEAEKKAKEEAELNAALKANEL